MEKEDTQLKGIGIPIEVLINYHLSPSEKIVFGIIQNLNKTKRGCWASNGYIGRLAGLCPQAVSNAVRKLIKFKYLYSKTTKKSKCDKSWERNIYENQHYKEFYREFVLICSDRNLSNKEFYTKICGGIDEKVKGDRSENRYPYTNTCNEENSERIDNKKEIKVVSKETTCSQGLRPRVKIKRRPIVRKDLEEKPIKLTLVKKVVTPSDEAKSIRRYWKDNMGLCAFKEGTKSYDKDLLSINKLLNGTAFNKTEYSNHRNRKFSVEEIHRSINRFALAAKNADYLPSTDGKKRLQKMPINEFIYNRYSRDEIGKSNFIHYLENEPKVSPIPVKSIEDKYPNLTSAIKKKYIEDILGGISPPKFSDTDENHFKLAAIRTTGFFNKHKKRIMGRYGDNPSDLAEHLLKSITTTLRDVQLNKVQPSWLSSDNEFDKHLPAYLYDTAILRDDRNDYSGGISSGNYHPLSEPLIEL